MRACVWETFFWRETTRPEQTWHPYNYYDDMTTKKKVFVKCAQMVAEKEPVSAIFMTSKERAGRICLTITEEQHQKCRNRPQWCGGLVTCSSLNGLHRIHTASKPKDTRDQTYGRASGLVSRINIIFYITLSKEDKDEEHLEWGHATNALHLYQQTWMNQSWTLVFSLFFQSLWSCQAVFLQCLSGLLSSGSLLCFCPCGDW